MAAISREFLVQSLADLEAQERQGAFVANKAKGAQEVVRQMIEKIDAEDILAAQAEMAKPSSTAKRRAKNVE